MTDDNIWELIALKLSGEATPEELAALEQILRDDPGMGFRMSLLEAAWRGKKEREPQDKEASFNRHLQRLSNHLSDDALQYELSAVPPEANEASAELTYPEDIFPNNKRRYRWLWAAAAAACIIIIGIAVFQKEQPAPKKAQAAVENLVSTRNGSKSKLQLPDGTEVWLNSGSRISYGNDFSGSVREVTLKGEAYFDVVKDSSRPFIIHTDAVDIRVLGTAFNVRSYPDEQIMETALIRGSVEITLHKNPGKKIILKPSEKLIVKNDSSTLVSGDAGAQPDQKTPKASVPLMTLTQVRYVDRARDSAAMETLWTKNKLAFDGETLEQVALKLERWFGVEVSIQSDRLKHTEYNAVFEEENLAEVLYALQLSGNFHYTIRKNEVIIKP